MRASGSEGMVGERRPAVRHPRVQLLRDDRLHHQERALPGVLTAVDIDVATSPACEFLLEFMGQGSPFRKGQKAVRTCTEYKLL